MQRRVDRRRQQGPIDERLHTREAVQRRRVEGSTTPGSKWSMGEKDGGGRREQRRQGRRLDLVMPRRRMGLLQRPSHPGRPRLCRSSSTVSGFGAVAADVESSSKAARRLILGTPDLVANLAAVVRSPLRELNSIAGPPLPFVLLCKPLRCSGFQVVVIHLSLTDPATGYDKPRQYQAVRGERSAGGKKMVPSLLGHWLLGAAAAWEMHGAYAGF